MSSSGKQSSEKLNILIYFIGSILLRGITYLTTPILTRLMSKEEYGILSMFTTWATIFAIFIGFQIAGTIASSKIKFDEKGFRECLHNGILLSLVTFAILSVIAMVFEKPLAKILQLSDTALIPFLLVVAYGKSMANIYSSYTIQMKQPKKNVMFSVGVATASFVFGVLYTFCLSEKRYTGKIYADAIIYIVVIVIVIMKFCDFKKYSFNISYWKYTIGLSIPLIIHLLSTNIISKSDQIFITAMLGYETNAVYSVAYSIGMLGIIAVEVCFNVWTPWFFEKLQENRIAEISRIAGGFIILIAVVFSWLILFAPEIFWIMAPQNYASGNNCVIIVADAMIFNFLYRFAMCYEQYVGKMDWVAKATIIATFLNLVLNYFFIKKWGMEGAAIATVIATMVLWIIHDIVARKKIGGYPIPFTKYIPGLVIVFFASVVGFVLSSRIVYRVLMAVLLLILLLIYTKKNKVKIIRRKKC